MIWKPESSRFLICQICGDNGWSVRKYWVKGLERNYLRGIAALNIDLCNSCVEAVESGRVDLKQCFWGYSLMETGKVGLEAAA